MTRCSACSARVAPGYRFCPQCGDSLGDNEESAALSSAATSDRDERTIWRQEGSRLRPQMLTENKQVSVLFVDVCDSTALLQHSDPEESRDYLGKALDSM